MTTLVFFDRIDWFGWSPLGQVFILWNVRSLKATSHQFLTIITVSYSVHLLILLIYSHQMLEMTCCIFFYRFVLPAPTLLVSLEVSFPNFIEQDVGSRPWDSSSPQVLGLIILFWKSSSGRSVGKKSWFFQQSGSSRGQTRRTPDNNMTCLCPHILSR